MPELDDAISKHQGGAGILNEIKPPEGYSSIGVSCKNARQYSADERNIGNLPDRQLVGITSPPYEDSDVDGARKMPEGYFDKIGGIRHTKTVGVQIENLNNIGSKTNESYLSAMLQVYSEAYKSGISPLVLVTKNPTRNGKLRDLAGDTINILQQAGYGIFDYHRAILFREVTQGTLDGDTFTKPKGRLSFFKRLSYDKGNVVAKWEDVIFARIPLEDYQ